MCELVVLFDGYSIKTEDNTMKANCTCTLIKSSKLIIIDTMTAWDKNKLIEALAKQNVKPSDIDYVVCTHGHADHIGNNNLFTNAQHIVGFSVHRSDTFYEEDLKNGPYDLCKEVRVVATPGHTSEDVTVLAQVLNNGNLKCVAITGDLFEKEEDIENPLIWQELGTPELRKVQSEMRAFIINLADFIIPGHGPMFTVTDHMRELVKSQQIH